jgi:hypothetical protein
MCVVLLSLSFLCHKNSVTCKVHCGSTSIYTDVITIGTALLTCMVQGQLKDLEQRREAHVAGLSALADRFCFHWGTDDTSAPPLPSQVRSQPDLASHQSLPAPPQPRKEASFPTSSHGSSAGGAEWGAAAALAKIEKLNKQLHAVRQLALHEQGRSEAAAVWPCRIHNTIFSSEI